MDRYILRSVSTVTVTICYTFVLDVTIIRASMHLCSKFIGPDGQFSCQCRVYDHCAILLNQSLVIINCQTVGLIKLLGTIMVCVQKHNGLSDCWAVFTLHIVTSLQGANCHQVNKL